MPNVKTIISNSTKLKLTNLILLMTPPMTAIVTAGTQARAPWTVNATIKT